jgi:MarR family 2-MHQ and catechol resistance regulon transcriptional repressor
LPDEGERALKCWRFLFRSSGLLKRELSRHARKFQLTEAQFEMMEVLFRKGSMIQGDLVEELQVSYGEVTHLVETLRKKDYVSRRRRPRDRRFVLIGLTSFGKWSMQMIEVLALKIMVDRFAKLTPEEQEEFIRMCGKMGTE